MLLEALLFDKRGDQQTAIKTLLDLHEHAADIPSMRWEAESTLAHIYSDAGEAARMPTNGSGVPSRPFNTRDRPSPVLTRLFLSWKTEPTFTPTTRTI